MQNDGIIEGTTFRVKGWQLVALHQYGNSVCRAHWPTEMIIQAFASRGTEVEIYKQPHNGVGGYNIYTIVNKQHRNYRYITGGIERG